MSRTAFAFTLTTALCLSAVEARADQNVKLFSVSAGSANQASITQLRAHSDWNKRYHRVVQAGTPNQVAFYERDDGYLRIVRFRADGSAEVQATHQEIGKFDELISGQFGGLDYRDLLLFNRTSGRVTVYELSPSGGLSLLFTQTIPTTALGGRWDLIASGYLGGAKGEDLLVYNKTEGVARFYRSNGSQFVLKKSYTGWNKNWDMIVPAFIDGDAYTDFLFYNQDGGGTGPASLSYGRAKFISFGANFSLQTLSETTTEWPMSPHVIITPGRFTSDSLTDFIVYDSARGRGELWYNDGTCDFDRSAVWSWQNRWTSIVPVEVNGGPTDLLFFTTQRVLSIVPVGVNGASPDDFETWVETANEVYAPAGIRFELAAEPWYWDYEAFKTGTGCLGDADPDLLNSTAEFVRDESGPNSVVVFVRGGKGSACSNAEDDFVIMPPWSSARRTAYFRGGSSVKGADAPKMLAHELGHYFSLGHTMKSDPVPAKASPYDYDADARVANWRHVKDTPPEPDQASPEWAALADRCDESGQNDLLISPEGKSSYRLSPDRHNVMSYLNCDTLYRLTPEQARAVRESLWKDRRYLLE